MPRYLRPRRSGAMIFFTIALAQRDSHLLVAEVEQLRQAVHDTRAERPFGIEAWVVLPDHLHCIWRMPEGNADYATRWRLIKARFSRGVEPGPRRASHVVRGERAVWQRRFWEHHIRDEADFVAHLRYCRFNPVKHGLVARPRDGHSPRSTARSAGHYGNGHHAPYACYAVHLHPHHG
ncbi:REP-associated tyrosine transposase [Paracoccus chinensis]|uniref:Putative transposase n=1 Tax=Paracoccus chinensis TaxID=525640 RepID=A0A1G9GH35_9RHOB|nr:transposase [Paracoccus chinensis]SDK99998.1 putative transposase [Paracoccus chinensis]